MPYNYKTELQRYRKYYQSLEPLLEKPRSRAYTAIIFSFLAVSLFGWYAIRPTMETILYLRRQIADETEINKKMEDKISALIEAQAAYQEIAPVLPAVDQSLPPSPDAVPLAVQLRNLASASGTLLTSLQVATVPLIGKDASPSALPGAKPTPGTDNQKAFELSVTVRGPYAALRSFFEGIVSMRRIATVTSATIIAIRPESAATNSAQLGTRFLQLALRLKGYYLVE
ncbi:hypothetical protein A2Z00_01015 [Candidatus Gottesmanbacteria bacterium RBG_13_45_10]|uniref:Uncharacterized protein n=1 Tax=Candidatus Gottesmanbacteria bacterium RBG_13_45_10 TaxID=1798370 RepID=A0A1F5ZGJ7_9BACT|nr:MAG: hypothetical protein A2Z00_01015 [Candidatus Gottesmanbacteria bacterium RBG_13_45_10]